MPGYINNALFIIWLTCRRLRPSTRTTVYPGGREIHNFRRPYFGYRYYVLGLSEPCPGIEKKTFFKYMYISFAVFSPKLSPLGSSSWNLQLISCLLILQCYIPNLIKICPTVRILHLIIIVQWYTEINRKQVRYLAQTLQIYGKREENGNIHTVIQMWN